SCLHFSLTLCSLSHLSCLSCYRAHRDLHSFPTRRSSDLRRRTRNRARSAHGRRRTGHRACPSPPPGTATRTAACRSPSRRGDSQDRKSTRLNSSHVKISYAVFCLKKKKKKQKTKSHYTMR